MRILLVNPPRFEGIPVIREDRCEITERYSVVPPYSLLQIASILRSEGHQVLLIDANGEDIGYEELNGRMRGLEYDAMIFRFTPTTFDADMRCAEISKLCRPDAKTIGICYTLSMLAESVLKNAEKMDIYVVGEPEIVVKNVVHALSAQDSLGGVGGITYRDGGGIILNEKEQKLFDYEELPMPAFDLLENFYRYYINNPSGKPFSIIYASKGCPYSCTYCTVAKTKLRKKSAEKVLEEIEYLKRAFSIKTVSFFDETFTIDRERVLDICKGIKERNLRIRWYCNTRADLLDDKLLRVMYESGCRGISLGIESGSQRILDNVNKGVTVAQNKKAVEMVKKAGINVYCSFIIGLPGENKESFDETLRFLREAIPTGAQFNVFVPYPGTRYWNDGLDWKSLFQHKAVMSFCEFTPEEITRMRKMAYMLLYTNPRWIAQNVCHVIANPDEFWMAAAYVVKILDNFLFHGMEHAH